MVIKPRYHHRENGVVSLFTARKTRNIQKDFIFHSDGGV
jgi:hypothetical protein